MRSGEFESGFEYEPPRVDTYDYSYFSPEENPAGVLLAKQIQAQSYVHMRIARPEALITLEDGSKIMSPEGSNPTGSALVATEETRIEYALGIRKGTTDLDPASGELVEWRKLYAPLDSLPAYQFCKDSLWPGGEQYLRSIQADPYRVLVEPEGLGKTQNAAAGVVKEFIRAEVQRALGHGEVWLMGLVEGTAFESFVHNWGRTAVKQIGEPRLINNQWICEDVALVPTIMDIDNFYADMASDILMAGDHVTERQLRNFVYMAEGLTEAVLGSWLVEFREKARRKIEEFGEEK